MMRLHYSLWHAGYLLLVIAVGVLAVLALPGIPWLWLDVALRILLCSLIVLYGWRSLWWLRRLYPLDLRYHRGQWQVYLRGAFVDARLHGTFWDCGVLMLAALRCEGRAVLIFAGRDNMRPADLCRLRRLVLKGANVAHPPLVLSTKPSAERRLGAS